MKSQELKRKFLTSFIVVVFLGVLANIAFTYYFIRFDITKEKRYSLSKVTKDIISTLKRPITVKAYFSSNVPTNYVTTKKDLREMLVEYNRYSRGNVVYEFRDPIESEEMEQKALKEGIQPINIAVREKDQLKQIKGYMGLVIEYGEKREVIPFLSPEASIEYTLTSSIRKLTIEEKPKIAFMVWGKSIASSRLRGILQELQKIYQVEDFYPDSNKFNLPENTKTLCIISPEDSLLPAHINAIDSFLTDGGSLFISYHPMSANFRFAMVNYIPTNFHAFLKQKGIEIENKIVVDSRCGYVGVRQNFGGFNLVQQIPFPYFPIITKFAEHPITKGIPRIMLQLASPLKFVGDTSKIIFKPIAFTSEYSGTFTAPLYLSLDKEWNKSDFPEKHIPVVGILEGKWNPNSAKNFKMVIIASNRFLVGEEEGANEIPEEHMVFTLNALEWLSEQTELVDLRTKLLKAKPILKELSDTQKAIIKWLNFTLPILIVIGIGIWRYILNQKKKLKYQYAVLKGSEKEYS